MNYTKQGVLLVEPDFPYPNKSKHSANGVHKNFVPIGLLKLGAFYKDQGKKVKLVRGNIDKKLFGRFIPDSILITSLFTYWSSYVWEAVSHYRKLFPEANILIGGIYVTLHHDTSKFKKLQRKFKVKKNLGLHLRAENYLPDYSLVKKTNEYHATHAMRGCVRNCSFCGTWRIEPKLIYKTDEDITEELKKIGKKKVIFYDNNFFANPNIDRILKALAKLKIDGRRPVYECQSGFDGRIVDTKPYLAKLLKQAGFKNIRFAWDNSIDDEPLIQNQLRHFIDAGYPAKDISIFMIYNFNIPLEDMVIKQKYCLKWGVQISDCRFRPLELDYDNYNPAAWRTGQTSKDYYIHKKTGWTDRKIRLFRNLVRTHNITIRYAKDKQVNFNRKLIYYWNIDDPKKCLKYLKNNLGYSKDMERWSAIHNTYKFFGLGRPPRLEDIEKDDNLKLKIKLMHRFKNIYRKRNINSKELINDVYRIISDITKRDKSKGDIRNENFVFDFIENKIITYCRNKKK